MFDLRSEDFFAYQSASEVDARHAGDASSVTQVTEAVGHESNGSQERPPKQLTTQKKVHNENMRRFVAQIRPALEKAIDSGVKSYSGLAKRLNDAGVSTFHGKGRWHEGTVKNIVTHFDIEFTPVKGWRIDRAEPEAEKLEPKRTAAEYKTARDEVTATILRMRARRMRFDAAIPVSKETLARMVADKVAAGAVTKCDPFMDSKGNRFVTFSIGLTEGVAR